MQSFSWENAILLANGKNAVILYYTKVYRSAVLRFRENQFSIQVFPTLKIRNCCYYYCRYPRVTNLIYFEFQGNFSAKKDTFQETDVLLWRGTMFKQSPKMSYFNFQAKKKLFYHIVNFSNISFEKQIWGYLRSLEVVWGHLKPYEKILQFFLDCDFFSDFQTQWRQILTFPVDIFRNPKRSKSFA